MKRFINLILRGGRIMSVVALIIAFCGGVVAAVTGALQACMLAGIMGILVYIFPKASLLSNMLTAGFIPYVSFGGCVVATAYAANIRKFELAGTDIHKSLYGPRKDVSVLCVSGIFAVLGYVVTYSLSSIKIPIIDMGSMWCIASEVFARYFFGHKDLINTEFKSIPRYKNQKREWFFYAFWGAVIGLLASFIVVKTGNMNLPFFISLASLIFMFIDGNFPATHHISMTAAYAVVASGGNILVGAIFGALAEITRIFCADVLNTKVSTHLDPPATTIGILSVVIFILFKII